MELQAGARLLLQLGVMCYGHAQIQVHVEPRYASIVDVTNGGTWGDWAWPEMCPDGYFASGFSVKVKVQTWVLERAKMCQIAELNVRRRILSVDLTSASLLT